MMTGQLTELTVINAIKMAYTGNCRYSIPNIYLFKHDWESDVFIQKESGYCYEMEVKISRPDFFADKKKVDKHKILSTGTYMVKHWAPGNIVDGKYQRAEPVEKEVVHKNRPNKFYYVVPENLIQLSEVPDYAGLLYYNPAFGIKKIKEAPFIHKEVINYDGEIARKLYFQLFNANERIKKLETQLLQISKSTNSLIS